MDIRRKITERGFKLAKVAELIGTSPSAFQYIVNGDNPQYQTLKKIADVLGITVGELISDSDDNRQATIICPHCGKPITLEAKDAPDPKAV
ncbi:MAG: helix-turn-helix transcriptional regulator [Prevotella sp.]|nr:helix-turn-helix transcriptional regulator [Prevotella sp.]